MFKYNSLNSYLKKRFGKKIYKVAIDCGFTCPNRDGTKGRGGCIFCSEGGSGDFAQKGENISKQIDLAIDKIRHKVPENAGYICYFQAFTNTYAPVKILEKNFYEAINHKDIVALSIATRPDSITDECYTLLKRLNEIKPIMVELGLQTANEDTANYINRCFSNEDFVRCIRRLKSINIEVVVHIILGLPNETVEDAVNTVRLACKEGADGVKLQLLHVLKNTKLAETDYEPLSMEEYFEWVKACIEIMPPEVVIHRLTGDGDKKTLIKPLWSANKHNVLNSMNRYLKNVSQSSKYNGAEEF